MRWEDERYVRVYTRDTVDWLALSFDAQALFLLLLRKVDRAGLLDLGRAGKRGVAVAVGHPRDWARLEPALEELLEDGCVRLTEDGGRLLVPNFLTAQEAKASDRARQQKSRETARDVAAMHNASLRDASSHGVTGGHEAGQSVTRGHVESQPVTPSRAVLSRAVLSRAVPNHSSPAPADAVSDGVDDLPDATEDAVPDERPLLTLAYAEPDRPEPKKPKAAKPKPPAETRGDPRHKPLTDALVAADAEVTGKPYGHRGGRDAKAVSECLALADQDAATSGERAHFEVLRRWRIARRWRGFPACNSLSDLAANWNAYARDQSAVAPTNLRAPVRAETQPQYDPSKPSCVTLTGRDAI